jgi:hypothetical protein
MHKQQAIEAQQKREKACKSKTSAIEERNAMVVQVKAGVARHEELMKFVA